MVTRLINLFLLFPLSLWSLEFTASVNRTQVNVGESFNLTLSLKDGSTKGGPSLDKLKNDFFISSQQQSQQTKVMNGRVSSVTSWKLVLTPLKEGEIKIPPLSIETTEGVLMSHPIKIHAIKGNGAGSENASDISEMNVSINVSNLAPYKNEPVFMTVKLVSKAALSDARIQKFTVDNAIVEMNGEPKVSKTLIDGVDVDVVDFNFLLTPLKMGPLNIPPLIVQGTSVIKKPSHKGSFFDDEFESFFRLQGGFNQLKPFALATTETTLNVKPAIPEVTPWLPAKSIVIEDTWDNNQILQVGEPITLGYKIIAEGIMSNQLPALNELQSSSNNYKIYSSKPVLGDEIKEDKIYSYREEQYTIIPQQPGALTLPESTLTWWNTIKHEKITIRLPSKTLEILPPPEKADSQLTTLNEHKTGTQPTIENPGEPNFILFAVVGALATMLLFAFVWVIKLQKRIARLTESPEDVTKTADEAPVQDFRVEAKPKPSAKRKKEKLQDLNPT